jgi:hypothetical protein
MNALNEIQNEAKVIVEQLADRQINQMKENYNAFLEWMSIDGNELRSGYGNQVDTYQSAHKYIYMTQFKTYNRELNQYELPVAYPSDYRGRTEMSYYKDLMYMVNDLRTMMMGNWEAKYREAFIGANMVKLNRALAKDITNDMSANNIQVSVGGDGAEVTAIVDQTQRFKTFGTLCGGGIQCLHYRYRSSLKPLKA